MPPSHHRLQVRPEGSAHRRRHRARLARDQGRAGKGVTLVKGLALDDAALAQLGKQLKAACGSVGTVKEGVIEVQGDHCDRVIELLKQQGHTVKRAGG